MCRQLLPSTLATRIFLLVVTVEAAVDVTLEALILLRGEFLGSLFDRKQDEQGHSGQSLADQQVLPVYLAIFAMVRCSPRAYLLLLTRFNRHSMFTPEINALGNLTPQSRSLFQFVLAVDAIYNRNTIQIFGLVLFNLMFLAYAIISVSEVRTAFQAIDRFSDSVAVYVTIVPIMIGVAQAFFCVLSFAIWKEFGWDVFKTVRSRSASKCRLNPFDTSWAQTGASRRCTWSTRVGLLSAQEADAKTWGRAVFICICKFDTFFVFGFTLQFVVLVLKQDDVERWLTIAAAPVTLGILAAGFVAARREIKWLMATFVSGCVLGMGYFAFKLFRIFQNTDDRYSQVKKSLTTFSVISLIALLATVLQAMLVFRNFGKGLKFHMTLNRLPKHSAGGMGKPSPGLSDSGYLSDGMSDQGMHYKLESAASACAVFSDAVLIGDRLTDEHRLMRTASCRQRILSGLEGVYSVHFSRSCMMISHPHRLLTSEICS
jgi:hypothetical protein